MAKQKHDSGKKKQERRLKEQREAGRGRRGGGKAGGKGGGKGGGGKGKR